MCVDHIRSTYFNWINDEKQPIPSLTPKQFGYCQDNHTLRQHIEVWRAVIKLFLQGGEVPLLPIRKILPALVSAHNKSKGYVDSLSSYFRESNFPYHRRETEASLWDTLVLIVLINVFAICKWASVEAQLDSFTTLEQLRRQAIQIIS